MKVTRTVAELRQVLDHETGSIGFVPTMGALHAGHMSLIDSALTETHVVVVSIFVNPLQFGAGEDFDRYPRDEAADLAMLEGQGVDIAFLPSVEEMYPHGATTTIDVGRIGEVVEGAFRPGHFNGVATVVAKLFGQVRPHLAFFGQKDAQQIAVIRRMVTDLSMRVRVEACATVREPDGLALSSRNRYLSVEDRTAALALYSALKEGARIIAEGGDAGTAQKEMEALLAAALGVELDYAVAVDPDDFEEPQSGKPVLLAVAAQVGSARLIDNVSIGSIPKATEEGA